MRYSFDHHQGLIIVRTELAGPAGTGVLQLALDTGATDTVIRTSMLVSLGYDLSPAPDLYEVTMGGGVEFVARVLVTRLKALGQERTNLPVLCHTLPPSAGVDGLLGLDFLRDQALTIDFRQGEISLT